MVGIVEQGETILARAAVGRSTCAVAGSALALVLFLAAVPDLVRSQSREATISAASLLDYIPTSIRLDVLPHERVRVLELHLLQVCVTRTCETHAANAYVHVRTLTVNWKH